MMRNRPSPAFGFHQALVLSKLVVVVWLASMAVFLPARVVVWTATAETMASLPAGELPAGDALLIVVELLSPVWAPLVAALLSGGLIFWIWTVLWHASVVRWFVLSGNSGVRLTEIFGRGLLGWWRWARLGLTSVSVLVVAHAVIWLLVWIMVDGDSSSGERSSALIWMLAGGIGFSLVVVIFGWLATLRASWLLGVGDRRSAVLAWFAGLRMSVVQPGWSLVTLMVWALPGLALTAVPLALGAAMEVFRGGVAGAAMEIVAGLSGAFCWVALYLSFAPVTGLVKNESRQRNVD